MSKLQELRRYLSIRTEGHSRKSSIWRALIAWIIWRVFLTLWGYAVWSTGILQPDAGREWLHGFRPAAEGLRAPLVDIWLRWDTVHYLRIIEFGYGPDGRSAFFPLYPYLGRAASLLFGGDNLLGLLLVSNLAALGAFYLLDRLAIWEGLKEKTPRILFSLAFYPASFLLFAAYPQSLVLFLSLATYLTARNGRIVVALICGVVAGLTHSTAIPLTALFIGATFSAEGKRWKSLLPALGPALGVGAFLIWRMYVGYPSYQDLQWSVPGRQIGLGIDPQVVMTPWIWLARGWHNLLALALGIGVVWWAYRKRKYDWALFHIAHLLIPVVRASVGFEPLDGLARYALAGFPVYFAISEWISQGWRRLALLGLAIGANLYLCGLFLLWGFIG